MFGWNDSPNALHTDVTTACHAHMQALWSVPSRAYVMYCLHYYGASNPLDLLAVAWDPFWPASNTLHIILALFHDMDMYT